MADLSVIAVMFASAMVPFALMARLMLAQKSGLALSVISLIAAALAICVFASSRPMGIDPLRAIGIAMVCLLPALIGAGAGALLGHMILRRRLKD
jgi:uncharacterized membrane protein